MEIKKTALELLKLEGEATEAPWIHREKEIDEGWLVASTGHVDNVDHFVSTARCHYSDSGMSDAKRDAQFIAFSRSASPKLARALLIAIKALEHIRDHASMARINAENALKEIEDVK